MRKFGLKIEGVAAAVAVVSARGFPAGGAAGWSLCACADFDQPAQRGIFTRSSSKSPFSAPLWQARQLAALPTD